MANPGSGNKFLSVNLNKSYGQHHNNQHYSNRTRPGGGSGGGGAGGMVVLSRPRSSQKPAISKLSVPRPLNLPSLRREHERIDSLGSGGGGHSGGGLGGGTRPASSVIGWTKPAFAVATLDNEGPAVGGDRVIDIISDSHSTDPLLPSIVNGAVSGTGVNLYMPPSARMVGTAFPSPSKGSNVGHKAAMVLRGEDFPSLQATLPANAGAEKKHKDDLNQKQKLPPTNDYANKQTIGSQLRTNADMRPQSLSRYNLNTRLDEDGAETHSLGGSTMSAHEDRNRKEYFPGPLPLVRLNPRSDWADDERDIGHGLTDRGKDGGYSRSEPFWDTDFDFLRPSVPPQKQVHNLFDRRGQRDNGAGKTSSSEVTRLDPHSRDLRISSREGREGNSWRASSPRSKNEFASHGFVNERNNTIARTPRVNREAKEHVYGPSFYCEISQNDVGRRDAGYKQVGRQPWNDMIEFSGKRGSEHGFQECHSEQYDRSRGENHPNISVSKSSFYLAGKGLPINDPILSFGREKRSLSKSERSYADDPFDGEDPFSGGFIGLVKKKKEVQRQTDFHDPVRESFEAELERVEKMQEQERRRIIEEQERAIELARKEEEERLRMAREKEEKQRRLEEEAREAAWRVEQERLEVSRRAEEQRITREEEKRRILREEERRKQAAKQKLLELEERIARRHAEASKVANITSSAVTDEKVRGVSTERDVIKVADVENWEDTERMAERITNPLYSDSSEINKPLELSSRPQMSTLGSSDRGKSLSSWKRDVFDSGSSSAFLSHDQDNGHWSPRQDASIGGRGLLRKEFYVGARSPSRNNIRGNPDSHADYFGQLKGQRWNISGDGDQYSRNSEIDSEFHDNVEEKLGDAGWGQDRSRGSRYPLFSDRMYQNPETEGLHSFGRSRYSIRQPRVLPPPSMTSMLRGSNRGENPGPSSGFVANRMLHAVGSTNKLIMQTRYDGCQGNVAQAEINFEHENNDEVHLLERNVARCDSQSTLSVSSPPDSPVPLSHDDLDECGNSPVSSAGEVKDVNLIGQGKDSVTLPLEAGKENAKSGSSIASSGDEEWTVENDERLQEQEEYDEDEDGYEEEDDMQDGEDEAINLTREFEGIHLEDKGSLEMADNLILGFNEGVEVGMPNDEFDGSLSTEKTKFVAPEISMGNMEEQGFLSSMHNDVQALQPVDGPTTQLGTDKPSGVFRETEKMKQDMVLQPEAASETPVTLELTNHLDSSNGSCLPPQSQVPPSSGHTITSSLPSTHGQPEIPVKLQFGLFYGPSLIPSPVPAIQIGSIQMPLHLHPPVAPSLSHMPTPQPPVFQFGQLRYTSPVSRGVVPLAPQSMPFCQPNVSAGFSLNQSTGGHMPIQSMKETLGNSLQKNNALSSSVEDKSRCLPLHLDISLDEGSKHGNSLDRGNADNDMEMQKGLENFSQFGDVHLRPESGFEAEDSFLKNSSRESENQPQAGETLFPSFSEEKDLGVSNMQVSSSGGGGKRYVVTVRNAGSRSLLQASETSPLDFNALQRKYRPQRTEFRVRNNVESRHSGELVLSNTHGYSDKFSMSSRGIVARRGSRRTLSTNRQLKQSLKSGLVSELVSSREQDSECRIEKVGKDSLRKSKKISHPTEDVDAALQNGVVQIFEQPGIEAPSDDDDFIEVRSKRQMLNDRREQREKEIKAKLRGSKMPRKGRSSSQSTSSVNSSKVVTSVNEEAANISRPDFVSSGAYGLTNIELSTGFKPPMVSQPLPPIGTPPVKADNQSDIMSQTIKSFETSSLTVVSGGGKNIQPGIAFESKGNILNNVQSSAGSWANSLINPQVMSATQKQLDGIIKPVEFSTYSSVGDPINSVSVPVLPSSSILTKDKSFSSAASPINSLLAGEKIQFGAVTSPTILPPSSNTSNGIGHPGPSHSDAQVSEHLPAADNDCSLFLDKEKKPSESCAHLVDCESEAEAAASAVAVAAIISDEIIGNDLGTCATSSSECKSFGGSDMTGVRAGVSADQLLSNRSRAEESFNVALPADLSVETPISLWPHLPSPQNSSSPMLSHVPGGPHSHFPFYDMNPMLGGTIYGYGPHDESASTQPQPQKSNASVSGPLGSWHNNSGLDSLYGHPSGFTGPFISPGTIPGVQGPPHMVVYNHFAPVGQFGQVGLSFMGTTYIQSGKQPDWKRTPASSAMGIGEGDLKTMNIVSSQRNPANMPAPLQHLAPGSPLLPIASPLAVYDITPFQQSSPDMSVQAAWSNVPSSSVQSVPVSVSLQQHPESVLPSQLKNEPALDCPLTANRFPESQTSTPSVNGKHFLSAGEEAATQLPGELRLVSSSSAKSPTTAESTVAESLSSTMTADAGKKRFIQNGGSSSSSAQNNSSSFRAHPSHQRNSLAHPYGNSSGYNYQRGGSQKNSSSVDWANRRVGYQVRSQSLGGEKNFASSKMKQIYVAKQTTCTGSGGT